MKPRLLDLFCGAGGCSVGYARAGFEVVGVDIAPQPNYPFEFVRMDALEYLDLWMFGLSYYESFQAIHASPPCQAYTTMNNRHASNSPPLIAETRNLLGKTGLPYVIENVLGALPEMVQPYTLTGEMFGLRVHRPRLFETSFQMMVPPRVTRQADPVAVYGKLDGRRLWTRRDGSELRAPRQLEVAAAAMGVDWMTWDELRESIPPVYTEFVGAQILDLLRVEAAA